MSSTLSASQVIERQPPETNPLGRRSWGLIALGLLLLIAAAWLFWWGWRHLPQQGQIPEKYLGAIPPLGRPDAPPAPSPLPLPPSPSPTPNSEEKLNKTLQKRPTAVTAPRRLKPRGTQSIKPRSDGTKARPESEPPPGTELLKTESRETESRETESRETESRKTESNPPPAPSPTTEKLATVIKPPLETGSPVETASPAEPTSPVRIASPEGSASPVATQPEASPSLPSSTPAPQPVSVASSKGQTSPASAPASANPCEEKRNIFRRAFDWFINLFKKSKRAACSESLLVVSVSASSPVIRLPCPPGSTSESCPTTETEAQLTANVNLPDEPLVYTWTIDGGTKSADAQSITWSFFDPGNYTATVMVDDGHGRTATTSTMVQVVRCCRTSPPPCPTVSVSCPLDVAPGAPLTFTATPGDSGLNYNWSLSAGTISSGKGTSSITLDTAELIGQFVTATVEIGGLDPSCSRTASCTASVMSPPALKVGSIKGTVRGRDGKRISNPRVTVKNAAEQYFEVEINPNGEFHVRGLPPGTYYVKAEDPVNSQNSPSSQFFPVEVKAYEVASANIAPLSDATPTPTPSSSPSPGPTPSPDASPSPTGSPTASPASTKILRESDKISATFPEPFLKDKESTVTLNLARVLQEVEVTRSVDVTTGTVTITDKLPPIRGAPPGMVTPDNAGLYYTYVVVELQATGLVVLGQASEMKLYNRADQDPNVKPNETWTWRVTPQTNFTGRAELRFSMTLLWKLRDPALYPESDKEVWKRNVWQHTQEVHIGQPKLFVYGSTFGSLPLGLFAMGSMGVGWRRRKRLLGGDLVEEGVEAGPTPRSAAAMQEVSDEVTSTVYAPGRQRPGDSFLIQVFMHLVEQIGAVEKLATRADEDAYERDQTKLGNIVRGTILSFHLTMPGLDIKQPDLTCVWNGGPESVRFEVGVPENLPPRDIVATVIVAQDGVPIGTLKFKFKVVAAASAGPEISEPAAQATLSRYRRAFISYSSKDIDEVEKRVQGFIAAKMEVFMDVLNLQPGERWEDVLYKRIDASDAFFLFWSTAAKTSTHVKEEAMYADGRKKGKYEMPPDIIPIAVEHPIPEPWPELNTLHFRDPIFR